MKANPRGTAVVPRRRGRPPASEPKIDLEQALKMRLVNKLTYQQIADHFGVVKSAVKQRLKRFTAFLGDPDEILGCRNHKTMILEAVELELITNLMHKGKLEKASTNNVAYAYRQVSDQLRLEKGLSTENVGFLARLVIEAEERLGAPQASKPTSALTDGSQRNDETRMNTREKD
jgi:hypothetical protein